VLPEDDGVENEAADVRDDVETSNHGNQTPAAAAGEEEEDADGQRRRGNRPRVVLPTRHQTGDHWVPPPSYSPPPNYDQVVKYFPST